MVSTLRLLAVCAVCLPACAAREGELAGDRSGDDSGDKKGDTCGAEEDAAFAGLAVTPAGGTLALRVAWTTPEPARGSIRFETQDGRAWETPPGPAGTRHEAWIVGPPAGTLLSVVARLHGDDGDAVCSAPMSAQMGALPPSLPPVLVEDADGSWLDGGHVATMIIEEEEQWLTLLDAEGRVVWAWEHHIPTMQGLAAFRVTLDPAGDGVLYTTQGDHAAAPSDLFHVTWGGERTLRATVAGGHTDFALLPGGGYATLGWTVRDFPDGRRLLGDTVVVVDAQGRAEVIWDLFDHFSPDLAKEYPRGFLPMDAEVEDWSHANGISFDAERDELLVSVPILDGVVAVRPDGSQAWALTPQGGDFAQPDGPHLIAQPHSVHATSAGLLVFNRNDFTDPEGDCSEAVEIALDRDAGVARQSWSYVGRSCHHVGFLGSAEELDSGAVLVSFSSAGVIDLATPEAETAWRVRLNVGAAFGFASFAPDLGATSAP